MTHQKNLLSPFKLREKFVITEDNKKFIESSRHTIRSILDGKDPRTLLIVGPCSIHDTKACFDYAKKLKKLADDVKSSFFIVMRAYYEKPRSIQGWKGLLYDPYLDGTHKLEEGLNITRQFLLELVRLKVPSATEFLDPFSTSYFSDLISWGCIGARTAESQTHRQLASSLNLPISFKNSTSGSIDVAINGILNAASPHAFMGLNDQGEVSSIISSGNPDCHITLRGSDFESNYDAESVLKSLEALEKSHLKKRVLIDCSHGNSNKNLKLQEDAFNSVIDQIMTGNKYIKGLILESHLFSGNQPLIKGVRPEYGISITDPCLSYARTESLIKVAFQHLQKSEELIACSH